jgi:Mycobacterium membrane protein
VWRPPAWFTLQDRVVLPAELHVRGDPYGWPWMPIAFEVTPSGVSRTMCSCMFERLTRHRVGHGDGRRGFAIFRVLKRLWIPLLILIVLGAGGFTVSRLHGVFGSENRPAYADTESEEGRPYNPKHLVYEVFGPPGTTANISYFDVDAEPQYVEGASLPWSLNFPISEAAGIGNIAAQGDSGSIGCRILVDDEVKAERIRQGVNAFTFCVLKAA